MKIYKNNINILVKCSFADSGLPRINDSNSQLLLFDYNKLYISNFSQINICLFIQFCFEYYRLKFKCLKQEIIHH